MNAKSGIKLLAAGYLLPAVRGGRIAQGESQDDPTVIPAGSHRQLVGYPTVIPETLWDRSHRPGGIPVGSRRLSPLDLGIAQKRVSSAWASAVQSLQVLRDSIVGCWGTLSRHGGERAWMHFTSHGVSSVCYMAETSRVGRMWSRAEGIPCSFPANSLVVSFCPVSTRVSGLKKKFPASFPDKFPALRLSRETPGNLLFARTAASGERSGCPGCLAVVMRHCPQP